MKQIKKSKKKFILIILFLFKNLEKINIDQDQIKFQNNLINKINLNYRQNYKI